jgi:iduronate 2-sulfatase
MAPARIAALLLAAAAAPAAAAKHNVLYFIADDLRPEFLGPYGQKQLKTPNVDKLASEGLVFNAAYCQQAVCGPSRASFMTGRRPAHTNVFDNNKNFREVGVDSNGLPGSAWVTMPEHFKRSGWLTLGLGAIRFAYTHGRAACRWPLSACRCLRSEYELTQHARYCVDSVLRLRGH